MHPSCGCPQEPTASVAVRRGEGESPTPLNFWTPTIGLKALLDSDESASRIKSRLIGNLDPDEWDLPPKPKWMRWRTYKRYVERYDAYEAILDYGIAELMAKLLSK